MNFSLDALRRLHDTRRRIERLQWAARARVIREQLVAQRAVMP